MESSLAVNNYSSHFWPALHIRWTWGGSKLKPDPKKSSKTSSIFYVSERRGVGCLAAMLCKIDSEQLSELNFFAMNLVTGMPGLWNKQQHGEIFVKINFFLFTKLKFTVETQNHPKLVKTTR